MISCIIQRARREFDRFTNLLHLRLITNRTGIFTSSSLFLEDFYLKKKMKHVVSPTIDSIYIAAIRCSEHLEVKPITRRAIASFRYRK